MTERRSMTLEQGNSSVEEYMNSFTELLPYVPCIGENHFLGGLNREIFDRVMDCDDLNSFEDLVDRCRQVKAYIVWEANEQAGQSSSSLGTRDRAFKRRGCIHCGGHHSSDKCHRASGACFKCGEMGHLKKDCPQYRCD